MYTHTHHFNGHSPGKTGLAGCPVDSVSTPAILILSIVTEHDETVDMERFAAGVY